MWPTRQPAGALLVRVLLLPLRCPYTHRVCVHRLPRVAPEAAAVHLSAVMTAVRRGDCSVFVCPLSAGAAPSRSEDALALPLGLVPRR